jgi:undecaprenyl phosphate-alpha-L-ara4N flippase subunit ArnE
MYILRNYPFSQAYPLSSLAYVFGMIAALWLFDEHISLTAWIGVLLIMAGCYLVTR